VCQLRSPRRKLGELEGAKKISGLAEAWGTGISNEMILLAQEEEILLSQEAHYVVCSPGDVEAEARIHLLLARGVSRPPLAAVRQIRKLQDSSTAHPGRVQGALRRRREFTYCSQGGSRDPNVGRVYDYFKNPKSKLILLPIPSSLDPSRMEPQKQDGLEPILLFDMYDTVTRMQTDQCKQSVCITIDHQTGTNQYNAVFH
jgi:hypothetical protein